jgi:hypothetical protein
VSTITLRQLADAAPPPWSGMLTDHRHALMALSEEVAGLVRANQDLLDRGQRAVRQVMASIDS